MPGSNNEFDTILKGLVDATKKWEAKLINHVRYAEALDVIFNQYGWTREEFYEECNRRLKPPSKQEPAKPNGTAKKK